MTDHGYARASLTKQVASPDVQREMIEAHCVAHGWSKPLMYIDKATSSRIPLNERVAGAQMLSVLDRGDRIIITKLDRAFRSTEEFLRMMKHFQRIGVEVHILNFLNGQAVDFASAVGVLMVTMLAVVAEFERALTRERTIEAHAHARRNGGGGGQPRFGFKYHTVLVDGKPCKKQIEDVEERKQMREILRLRSQDRPWSWDNIREEFNYVRKWYRTKRYNGKTQKREWTNQALIRACKSELILQYREVSTKRKGASSE